MHNFIGKNYLWIFYSNSLVLEQFVCVWIWSPHKFTHQKPKFRHSISNVFFAECFYFSTFRSTFFEWSSAWRFYVPHHPSIWFVFMMLFSALESILLECPKLISKRSHICWHPIQQTFIIEFSCSDFHCVDLLSVRYWFVLFSLVCLLARSRHTFFSSTIPSFQYHINWLNYNNLSKPK